MIYSMSKVKYIFTEWPTAIAKMFSIEYEMIVTNILKRYLICAVSIF